MSQLPLFGPPTWSVSELTRYLRELLEGDYNLQDLWVQGEVSNLSRPGSGHLYFTLKDTACSIRCVMWRNTVNRQAYLPREGEAIEVHGAISLYEAAGQYQLYADLIRPAGEGLLYQEFLRLKARLEAEGLFDPERKRDIPPWPRCIGVVTSPTGAALRDILNTIRRRYPVPEVVLAPTPVQGDEAPAGIIAAISALNDRVHPDVIILARGGGSIEDLWAFNDEHLARTVAASAAPVITGVGHETDFTIVDFVSDLRAPTPTAAAELATPSRQDLETYQHELVARMGRALQSSLDTYRWELERLQYSLGLHSPQAEVRSGRQRVDDLSHRSATALRHLIKLRQARLDGLGRRLNSLNPLAVLSRGYAVVTQADGSVVRSPAQVQPAELLRVQVERGKFTVRVEPETDGAGEG